MRVKTLAFGLLATSMLAAPAFAQNNPPASTQGNTVQMNSTAQGGGNMTFFTNTPNANWRGSKFMGVDIYGANNEKIGDVNDLILDHEGNIQAVVIGVGGFLGIGEKDVAVPFKSVEWMQQSRSASSNTAAGNATANRPANTASTGLNTGAPGANTTDPGANTLGTTANNAGTAAGNAANNAGTAMGNAANDVTGTVSGDGSMRAYPDHGVLRMTKAELQNAPTYRYPDDTRASNANTNATTGARRLPARRRRSSKWRALAPGHQPYPQ